MNAEPDGEMKIKTGNANYKHSLDTIRIPGEYTKKKKSTQQLDKMNQAKERPITKTHLWQRND